MDASTTTFDRLALQIYSPRHEVYVNTKSTRLQDVERLGASLLTYLSEHMVTCARTHQVQQTGNFARELFVRFPETACLAYERILTHIPPRFTGPPQSRLDSAKLGSASDS